jgi:hypothetical protein
LPLALLLHHNMQQNLLHYLDLPITSAFPVYSPKPVDGINIVTNDDSC